MSDMFERLLVLGAGTMGAQIAQQAALGGADVILVDSVRTQLDRALATNREILERRVSKSKLDASSAEAALRRVTVSDDLTAAAADREWAIEAIVEDLAAKRAAFADLDSSLPEHAGIASNSSNIVISRLAGATSRPDRCCNMHFFHPVLVMEVCEVVRGPQTSDDTVERAVGWCKRMQRRPVILEKEIDGFIVNRVLGAASQEAFALLAAGVASVADIDTAARAGLNWPMGPFELVDFSGVDVALGVRRDRRLRQGETGPDPAIALLERMAESGRLGRKRGRGFYDYSSNPPTPLPLP